MGRARVDAIAVAASVLAVAMVIVYLAVIQEQAGEPAAWAVAALTGGAAAAAYGAVVTAPYRRATLLLAGLALVTLGVLAILTIGLPILLAGALCLIAAVRRRPVPTR
jgi:inner membrane protein involved in colicin E2 resistance